MAWAGRTENEARTAGLKYGKGVFPWAASGRSLSLGRAEGMTKLLFDEATGHVIGCGIVGPSAGELIAEAAPAIEMGADAADIGLTFTLTRHCRRPSPWQRRHSRAPSPTCTCRNGGSRRHGVVPASQEQDSMRAFGAAGEVGDKPRRHTRRGRRAAAGEGPHCLDRAAPLSRPLQAGFR